MITNNCKKLIAGLFGTCMYRYTPHGVIPVTDMYGNTCYLPSLGHYNFGLKHGAAMKETTGPLGSFLVGIGNKAATANDYSLDNRLYISTDLDKPEDAKTFYLGSKGTWLHTSLNENGQYVTTIDMLVGNDNDDEIVINEVGIGYWAVCYETQTLNYDGTGPGASNDHLLLLERTVLTEPVSIAAGTERSIRYQICADFGGVS